MKNRLLPVLAIAALLLSSTIARADQITSFGQLGSLNTFLATNNGDGTTSLDVLAGVSITNIISGATDPNALFFFEAESIGAASLLLGDTVVTQQFEGTFNLTNQAGTFSYLSGAFGGALVFGGNGGTGATFTSNSGLLDPLVMTTDLAILLGDPQSFSLSLSNLTPGLGISGDTINSFSASFTGTADAEQQVPVPEPATLTMLGMGLVMVGGAARRRLNRK